jgi:hypothetical protein
MRHARLTLALLLAAGCAEAPSLEVTLDVRAPDVDAVGLLLVRDDRNTPLIDCRVTAAGRLEGRCPFDEPATTWAPGEPLAFVLYGEPEVALDLSVEGLDARGEIVTSTRAMLQLPTDGSRGERRLVLLARTEPRARCGVDVLQDVIVPENQRDRTGLAVADVDDDGHLELVVATPRRLVLLRWARGDGRGPCALVQTATISSECTVRSGSLVVGELDPTRAGPEVGATCLARSSTNRFRLAAWHLESEASAPPPERSVLIPYVTNQTTRQVVADLDGDGAGEQAYLAVTSTVGPVVSVVAWRMVEDGARRIDVPGVRLSSPTTNLVLAPVVVSSTRGARDALAIGGHRGGLSVVESDVARVIDGNTATPPAAFAGASYERAGALPRVLYARDASSGTVVLETALEPGARGAPRPLADGQRTPGLASVALAVGDVDGQGVPSAVLAADGFVQVLPLSSTTAPARRFPLGEPVDGALVVLLADLDARPGAEIVAFQPKVGRVFALDGQGRSVLGFPLELGVPGPETRVVLADLDGDGALELVSLSYDRVNVVSLGPRTHRPEGTPWPEAFHDGRGSARSTDERDPRR